MVVCLGPIVFEETSAVFGARKSLLEHLVDLLVRELIVREQTLSPACRVVWQLHTGKLLCTSCLLLIEV